MSSKEILYQVKLSRRARCLRIAVYCDSRVIVTVPFGFNKFKLENFIEQKAEWILKKLDYFRNIKPSAFPKSSKREYKKYKLKAFNLVVKKAEQWNLVYGFNYNKINIKNQKTRWGSCSRKGNLNFNYKIVYLPEELLDYLVVHELCHLKEFNHSKKFWALVAKTIPDYLKLRKSLR